MQPDKLREAYPDLSEIEMAKAADNISRYIALAWKIYEDLRDNTDEL